MPSPLEAIFVALAETGRAALPVVVAAAPSPSSPGSPSRRGGGSGSSPSRGGGGASPTRGGGGGSIGNTSTTSAAGANSSNSDGNAAATANSGGVSSPFAAPSALVAYNDCESCKYAGLLDESAVARLLVGAWRDAHSEQAKRSAGLPGLGSMRARHASASHDVLRALADALLATPLHAARDAPALRARREPERSVAIDRFDSRASERASGRSIRASE